MGDTEMNDLLQTADVAVMAERTPDTIRQAVREGHLVAALTTSRGIRLFRRADVEAYLAARDERLRRDAARKGRIVR